MRGSSWAEVVGTECYYLPHMPALSGYSQSKLSSHGRALAVSFAALPVAFYFFIAL